MTARDLTVVLAVLLGALVALPALGMLFMGPGLMGPMMGPGMMGRGGWGGGVWGLALLLVAVIAIVVLLSKRHPADDPLAALKQRLAKGEITKEQYVDLKSTLQQS